MNTLPKIIYHGSATPLKLGDFLMPFESFDSDRNIRISAVFGTFNKNYAKKFAITALLKTGKIININNNKIICQQLPKQISEYFYVFELDSDGFELDARNEYFFMGEKEIRGVKEYNFCEYIEKSGIEIFELDNNNMPMEIDEFKSDIENKKYHKIKISDLIV